MSRTKRRFPGHYTMCPYNECQFRRWVDGAWLACPYPYECQKWILRNMRGLSQPEREHWPRYDGWWGWSDDTPNRPEHRRWLKRFTSKYRRRRGRLEIKRQLQED